MKLKVDRESDALYLRLDEAAVVESEEVQPGVILDYDAANNVVGVEIWKNVTMDLNMQDLASTVLTWMRYEYLCGRAGVVIERTLGLPIFDYVVTRGQYVEAEVQMPVNARRHVDYAFAPHKGEPWTSLMEVKMNAEPSEVRKDVCRLWELGQRRFLLYAQLDAVGGVRKAKDELADSGLLVPRPEENGGQADGQLPAKLARWSEGKEPDQPSDEVDCMDERCRAKLIGFDQQPVLAPTAMVAIWEITPIQGQA